MTTRQQSDIEAWLTEQIASLLGVNADEVDPHTTFEGFGLASRDAVSLSGDLEDWLGLRLSPTLLYQYPTIGRLAAHLAQVQAQVTPQEGSATPVVTVVATPAGEAGLAAGVDALSDEEAEALLLRKLAELEE